MAAFCHVIKTSLFSPDKIHINVEIGVLTDNVPMTASLYIRDIQICRCQMKHFDLITRKCNFDFLYTLWRLPRYSHFRMNYKIDQEYSIINVTNDFRQFLGVASVIDNRDIYFKNRFACAFN